MEYVVLNKEERRVALEIQLRAWEYEHWNLTVQQQAMTAAPTALAGPIAHPSGPTGPMGPGSSSNEQRLQQLENAIAWGRSELEKLTSD